MAFPELFGPHNVSFPEFMLTSPQRCSLLNIRISGLNIGGAFAKVGAISFSLPIFPPVS